jgi:hypothetical protein
MADPMSRVPYFFFVDREHGANAEASAKAGYEVPNMVTFILITPHGHKGDPMEFMADDFIARKGEEARKGSYDPSWVAEFKTGLAAFRDGKEIPREGTPLITWERILKSRREVLARRFPTVEDLAAVPDSAVSDIGMDGRVLRDMAKADIQAKKDLSPVVRELANANETMRQQAELIESLTKRLDALEAKPKK